MSWLDALLPIRRLLVAGKPKPYVPDLEFGSGLTLTVDEASGVATVEATGGGGGGSGTVTPDPDELLLRDGFGAAYATSFVGPAGAAAALTAQGANAVSITSGAAVNVYGGASADINLDSKRDVIVDVGSTSDEIAIKAGGTTKATITPGALITTIASAQPIRLESSSEALVQGPIAALASTAGDAATLRASSGAVVIGDGDESDAITITPNGSGGTTTIAGFQPMSISAAGAMTVQPAQATSGAGHAATYASGDAQSGVGGAVVVRAGDSAGTNQAGADVELRVGNRTGSGTEGAVAFVDGTGTTRIFWRYDTASLQSMLRTAKIGGVGLSISTSSVGVGGDISNAFVGGAISGTTVLYGTTVHRSKTFVTYARDAAGSATIASATTTSIVTFATLSNSVCQAVGYLTVSNDTDNEGACYMVRAAFKNVGGTVTQIGTTQTIAADLEDAGQAGLSAVLDFSGTDIRLRLTTDSGDTVNANGVLMVYERVLA